MRGFAELFADDRLLTSTDALFRVCVPARRPRRGAGSALSNWRTRSEQRRSGSPRPHCGLLYLPGVNSLGALEQCFALTCFLPENEHPRSEDMTVRWLTQRFRALLAELNRVLDHLSFAAEDWALGSLEHRDLPALLPTLIQSTHADTSKAIRATTFPIPLHDDFPSPEGAETSHGEDAIQTAISVLNEGNHRTQPFEDAFRFLRAAGSERIAGDVTRAVIDLATAMELLFSQLIEAAGPRASWDSARVQRALSDQTPLRGRVEDHLGPLLGARIDVRDSSTPWGRWWAEGYRRRNDAVHRGRRVTDEDCQLAWSAATSLIKHIRSTLRLQDVLVPVAEMLDVVRLNSGEPPWLDQRLPVEIDWF